MNKQLRVIGFIGLAILYSGSASALTTSFANATISGCPNCVVYDPSSLMTMAGQNLQLTAKGLKIASSVGFTQPNGGIFNVGTIALLAFSSTQYAANRVHVPLFVGFYAHKPGNINEFLTVRIGANPISGSAFDLTTDPRFQGVDRLEISIASNPYNLDLYLLSLSFNPL